MICDSCVFHLFLSLFVFNFVDMFVCLIYIYLFIFLFASIHPYVCLFLFYFFFASIRKFVYIYLFFSCFLIYFLLHFTSLRIFFPHFLNCVSTFLFSCFTNCDSKNVDKHCTNCNIPSCIKSPPSPASFKLSTNQITPLNRLLLSLNSYW